MRTWKTLIYALGIIPYVLITSMLTFYLHAAWILGTLPRYAQQNPKDLNIYSRYSPFIDFTGELWVLSFLVWIVVVIIYFNNTKKQVKWAPLIFSSIGQIMAVLLLISGIMAWYVG